ncbi:uncharacterized protein LOC113673270 [Pocillopora damicornis]|uniref:uncharacterized protein LOC113673270 n=1 Tax=Pocillopora damicornis TaxID=46731 RepID=UPI000F54FA3E|nr:uncharacterized protein LOC113673270 [Pocillopora damicornis]
MKKDLSLSGSRSVHFRRSASHLTKVYPVTMRALIFSSCIILIIANSLAEAAVASIPQRELTPNDVEDPNMHLFEKGPFDGGNGLRGPRKGRRDIDVIPQSELKSRDVTDPVAQKYRTRELPGGGTGRGPRKDERFWPWQRDDKKDDRLWPWKSDTEKETAGE